MSSDVATSERPLRADARRNRERVINAAREVFAEHGLEAQMDEIASRAGVGVGTVYRHFPTKDALVAALVGDRWLQLAAAADEFADVDDAWEAFSGWLWKCARLQVGNLAWAQLAGAAADVPGTEAEHQALVEVTQREVERARGAGAIRDDVTADDISMLMCGTCSVVSMTGGHQGDTRWERFFRLALEGLRA